MCVCVWGGGGGGGGGATSREGLTWNGGMKARNGTERVVYRSGTSMGGESLQVCPNSFNVSEAA